MAAKNTKILPTKASGEKNIIRLCPYCQRICLHQDFFDQHQVIHEEQKKESRGSVPFKIVDGNGFTGGPTLPDTDVEVIEPMTMKSVETITNQNNTSLLRKRLSVDSSNDKGVSGIRIVETYPIQSMSPEAEPVKQVNQTSKEVEVIDLDDEPEKEIIELGDNPERTFKCSTCSKLSGTHARSLNHLFTHFKQIVCQKCQKVFENAGVFECHRLMHELPIQSFNLSQKKCHECGGWFNTQKVFQIHSASSHDKNMALRCDQCPSTFTDIIPFQYHILSHSGKLMYVCHEFCGIVFDDKNALEKHVLSHKKKSPECLHQCADCAVCFHDKIDLLNHRHIAHGGQKPHYCNECQEIFYVASLYENHSCFRKAKDNNPDVLDIS